MEVSNVNVLAININVQYCYSIPSLSTFTHKSGQGTSLPCVPGFSVCLNLLPLPSVAQSPSGHL